MHFHNNNCIAVLYFLSDQHSTTNGPFENQVGSAAHVRFRRKVSHTLYRSPVS